MRSGRVTCPPTWHNEYQSHMQTQAHPNSMTMEYTNRCKSDCNALPVPGREVLQKQRQNTQQFLQTYLLKAGLKRFKEKGKAAIIKEMSQLDDRVVYAPIDIDKMTCQEKKRSMESLIFLTEKRDLLVKARMCENGSTQCEYMECNDASSSTVMHYMGCLKAPFYITRNLKVILK